MALFVISNLDLLPGRQPKSKDGQADEEEPGEDKEKTANES